MTQPELIFERTEFRTRNANVQRRMEAAGIDVLVVTDPANMTYLTGFDNFSWPFPQAVLVSTTKPDPVFVSRNTERNGALLSTYMDPSDIVVYPEVYMIDPDLHGYQFIGDVIRDRFGAKLSIGTELDTICFTPRAQRELERALPEATFVNGDKLVNYVRTVKSPAELQIMREAGAIAVAGMQAAIDTIAVGVRGCDVAAEVHRALISGTKEFGGTAPIRPTIANGERGSAPHLSWTDQPYEANTGTNVELGGARYAYHAGLSRTIFLGEPPKKISKLADVAETGLEAVLAKAGPGVTCHDVHAAWNSVLAKDGYTKASRVGYAIGLGYAPSAWIEGTASLMEGDKTVMKPGMTFHTVCGMWEEGHGYIISETFAINEHGIEVYSTLPREIIIKK